MRGQIDVFAKEAGFGRGAQEANVLANVMPAAAAVLAVIAVQGGLQHDGCPRGNSRDSRAGGDDFTRRLMSEHNRIVDHSIADGALGEIMQVGPADSHAADLYLNIARTGRFRFCFQSRKRRGSYNSAMRTGLLLEQAVERRSGVVWRTDCRRCDGRRRHHGWCRSAVGMTVTLGVKSSHSFDLSL